MRRKPNPTNTRVNLPLYNTSPRVPFFDIEWCFANGNYVHNPDDHFASSGDERTSCARLYQAWKEKRYGVIEACKPKCALCQYVGDNNDYVRGFVQRNGKREPATPHYPLPAIIYK